MTGGLLTRAAAAATLFGGGANVTVGFGIDRGDDDRRRDGAGGGPCRAAVKVAASVPGASCPLFPADNVWYADISKLPVHARSADWMASMSTSTRHLHPDFGPSFGAQPVPYGIPYIVVPDSHPKVPVTFDFADESDRGPYPFGPDTPIEGGANAGGDRHALMVDSGTCQLFELWTAHYASGGGSTAGSGAIWDLRSNALRPAGWTSADAAGLPILPGLLRADEVKSGVVSHAIRFTAARTDTSYLWPARHQAGSSTDPKLPPMGMRVRLRADFDAERVSGRQPGGDHRHAALRDVARRQRLRLVLQRHARRHLGSGADRGSEEHPGVGLRGRRRVVAHGQP